MNAIIAFNHFCEIHGPMVLFSTQSIHETKNIQILSGTAGISNICSACKSIDSLIFVSQDKESDIMFVSSEKSFKDAQAYLNIGAVKSLSSEVCFLHVLCFFKDWMTSNRSKKFKFKIKKKKILKINPELCRAS